MRIILFFLLLVFSRSAIGQALFTVEGFSKDYYGKVYISDTAEVFSPGWVAVYDRKTNKELIKVPSDELALSLHDGEVLANVKSLPYGEQSLVHYDDFNFDGKKDFALGDGQNSCYHGPSFRVYLATATGFSFNQSFTRLAQEYCGMFQVDQAEKKIYTMTKDGCCWHEFSEFIVEKGQPKAVKIITDSEDFPYRTFTEETWNGKTMMKRSNKTIDLEQEGIEVILSFAVPKNNKEVILFTINGRTLNYALVQKDSTGEFAYPMETVYRNPDFIFAHDSAGASLIFANKGASYKVYEQLHEVGIEITVGGKTYRWVGDAQSRKGSLERLSEVKLDNVVSR